MLDYSAFLYRAQVTVYLLGFKRYKGRGFSENFFTKRRYFEAAIKEAAAFAVESVLTHFILLFVSNREDSKRTFAGSVESQQLYPTAIYSYGQTGLSSSVSSCEDFAKNFQNRRG